MFTIETIWSKHDYSCLFYLFIYFITRARLSAKAMIYYLWLLHSQSSCISATWNSVGSTKEMLGIQLSDRVNILLRLTVFVGLQGIDPSDLGESKLFLNSCLIAEIKWTVGSGGGPEDLNLLQKLKWRLKASSALISLSSHRTISSLTASAQSPHIHFPW